MRNHAIHNTIEIKETAFSDMFTLDWVDEFGGSSEHICFVFNLENAVRVANGIAYDQPRLSITHPAFKTDGEL